MTAREREFWVRIRESARWIGPPGLASSREIDRTWHSARHAPRHAARVGRVEPAPQSTCLSMPFACRAWTSPRQHSSKVTRLVLSIACASVLAKTCRDGLMVQLDKAIPGYAFARHKGYGTAFHRKALAGARSLPRAPIFLPAGAVPSRGYNQPMLSPQVEYKPAGLRDLSALRQVEQICFGPDAWPLIDLIGVLSFPGIVRIKQLHQERMAGFIAGEPKPWEGTGWITTIGVLPEFRRLGIASRLILDCETGMQLPAVKLCVRRSNYRCHRTLRAPGISPLSNMAGVLQR